MPVTTVPLRTVILDDEPLARARLRRLLERVGGPLVDVVAELGSARELGEFGSLSVLDAVFLDIRMQGASGLDLAWPEPGRPLIVIVSAFTDHAVTAFDIGATDYLTKPVSESRLLQTLRRLFERRATAAVAAGPAGLTDRQTRLLVLLGQGLSNKEIGRILGISHHTVRNNLVDLFRMFGVSRRADLTRLAVRRLGAAAYRSTAKHTGTSLGIVARLDPVDTADATGAPSFLRDGRPS